MNRLSEKAPWPHSCATTHMPVHTVPVTAAYATHSGSHASLSGISEPRATHAALWTTEMAACLSDRIVSRVNTCGGIAARTCAFVGMSAFSTSIALPSRPLSIHGSSSAATRGAAVGTAATLVT
jgi:hypothetical protein